MTQCRFRRQQEGLGRGELAEGVGRDRAHALRRDVADALAEAFEAFERAQADVGSESALAVEALGQSHHVAQAIDDAQLSEDLPSDHHVEAVRAKVDRGKEIPVLQRQGALARTGDDVVQVHSFASRAVCAECGMCASSGTTRR